MTFNLNKVLKAVNWNKEDDGFTQAFWDQNVKQFWLPEEISVSKDLKTWNDLKESEKDVTVLMSCASMPVQDFIPACELLQSVVFN